MVFFLAQEHLAPFPCTGEETFLHLTPEGGPDRLNLIVP